MKKKSITDDEYNKFFFQEKYLKKNEIEIINSSCGKGARFKV